jgi:DNA replication and repair protein RecF
MRITGLSLTNFRNYDEINIQFHEKINVILGNNGQGKTNLLEGIYIFSMGKSFRTVRDYEMTGFGKDFFGARGNFSADGRSFHIEINMSGREKKFVVNGVKKTKRADLPGKVYIVVFSPEDLRIIKGEPDVRRKFLDREICQIKPLYYKNLSRYKKVVAQRNYLLKKENADEEMLRVWDENMVFYGAFLMAERKSFVKKLSAASKKIHQEITGGKEEIDVVYESNVELKEDAEIQREEFRKKLLRSRENDLKRKQTTSGPHKDDLKIFIGDMDIKIFGSQGQQKTAALSMKLAELKIIKDETEEDAIILMDDVLSELDHERQNFLLDAFHENQIFLSAAEMGDVLTRILPHGNAYRVSDGKIVTI